MADIDRPPERDPDVTGTQSVLDEIDRRFEHLRRLQQNWDSYSGYPLRPGVECRVRRILEILRDPRPRICMTAGGGISLAWPDGDDTEAITIGVQPEGGIEASFWDTYLEVPMADPLDVAPIRRVAPGESSGVELSTEALDRAAAALGRLEWTPWDRINELGREVLREKVRVVAAALAGRAEEWERATYARLHEKYGDPR